MKIDKKKLFADYIPMAAAAVFIIAFAVWRGQSFIKTLPTLVTLAVQLLLVRAKPSAFLLGGVNSVLYAVSYFSEALNFSAFFALAISMPMQIYSYFNWKKNTKGGQPRIKVLSLGARLACAAGIVTAWFVFYKCFGALVSSGCYVRLDSLIFVLGVSVTLLSSLRYVDAQYIHLISAVLSLVLWGIICYDKPENINYVIIGIYNLFRSVQTAVSWTKISKFGGEYEKIAD